MKRNKNKLYLLLDDIKELNDRYQTEFNNLKLHFQGSDATWQPQLNYMAEILLQAYMREVEQLSSFREVEFAIKAAETKARAKEQTPWRRCWLWRLIFQPLTNRAQDIIEKSEELKADKLHSEQERINTKLEQQIEAKERLKEIIKEADKTEPAKVLYTVPTQDDKQLPGQLELVTKSLRDKQKKAKGE
ncbi:MAG: hypothetical protein K2L12_08530 [Clostridia bacterium]|nr:hypothetical protein [Clostridia bacterium]